ncbi:MAG: prepilin-type N-terminal cleavage/methylation domain-containing protein [Elusimicrobia bacterium]|nr:prepilin-type N-terminal cleavage/methylation domain-containing protein [Elusimicrobiota bacterium]
MNNGSLRSCCSGFTLVELAVASVIFAMFMMGLMAVHISFLKQGNGLIQGDNRMRTMMAFLDRRIGNEVRSATRVDLPVLDTKYPYLQGGANVDKEGNIIDPTRPTHWFHFCVGQGGGCVSSGSWFCDPTNTWGCGRLYCMWHYGGNIPVGNAWSVPGGMPTDVDSCGGTVGPVQPTLLAENLICFNDRAAALDQWGKCFEIEARRTTTLGMDMLLVQPPNETIPFRRVRMETSYTAALGK